MSDLIFPHKKSNYHVKILKMASTPPSLKIPESITEHVSSFTVKSFTFKCMCTGDCASFLKFCDVASVCDVANYSH